MPKRAIVALPRVASAAAWDRVRAVRDQLDPLARYIAAHLTLVFPFDDPTPDGELEAHVRTVAASCAPLAVTLAGVTLHDHEYLFLNVKRGNDAIVALHDALYTGALARHRSRMHTFVPHVTVGRVRANDVARALELTATLADPIAATLDALTVYRIDTDGDRPALFDLPLTG
jgi:2'-5' RNA ligase